jgi:hypothetical protein
LRAQHAAEVMGGVAFYRRGVAGELFNEEASPHGWSLTADCGKR